MSIRFAAPKDCVSERKLPRAPEGRYGHRSILYGDKMLFYGGYNGSRRLSDIFEFDLFTSRWRRLKTYGDCPRPRDCHSCVLYKNRMIVFGGGTGYQWMNDLYEFHIPSRTWYRCPQNGTLPQGRAGHSAVIRGDELFIFGGWNGFKTMNDLHCFNLRKRVWRKMNPTGTIPESRDSHCAVINGDNMIVIGGGDGHRRLEDMYSYNIPSNTWSKIGNSKYGYVGRAGHFVALFQSSAGNQLVMYGGGDGNTWIKNVYRFCFQRMSWDIYEIENCASKIPGCYGCSGAIYGNRLVLFGGGDGANFYNTLYEVKLEDFGLKTQNRLYDVVLKKKRAFLDCVVRCQDDECGQYSESLLEDEPVDECSVSTIPE